jgi:ubiquinone/menaquinone biosynthesis C-methylase UbiE
MNHADHVQLLKNGGIQTGRVWADLGSGAGAFTLALADLLGESGTIHSVDRDAGALREQARAMAAQFPKITLHQTAMDFTKPLDLPPLDGIVMANSLHFIQRKEPLLERLKALLRPNGRLILVEYNVDSGNPYVPYPLSYGTWEQLAKRCGFATTRLLATVPSRWLKEIYSAVSTVS